MNTKDILQVLVVDDNITSRITTVELLREIGLKNIHLAKDGRDAFNKISGNPVHLIISDVYMPDVSGMQLLSAVRKNPNTARTGFILVTGRKDATVVEQAKQLRANNVLAKPLTVQVLRGALEAVVGKL